MFTVTRRRVDRKTRDDLEFVEVSEYKDYHKAYDFMMKEVLTTIMYFNSKVHIVSDVISVGGRVFSITVEYECMSEDLVLTIRER